MQKASGNFLDKNQFSLEEALELLAWLKRQNLGQERLKSEVGIHQSQISRILKGRFKKVDGNALILCKYANRLKKSSHGNKEKSRQSIIDSALALWDGNEDSAESLIKFFRIIPRIKASI